MYKPLASLTRYRPTTYGSIFVLSIFFSEERTVLPWIQAFLGGTTRSIRADVARPRRVELRPSNGWLGVRAALVVGLVVGIFFPSKFFEVRTINLIYF
jgi:hypothetical protein